MKKMICLVLAALIVAGGLAGCARRGDESAFTADNEIITYQKIDPDRTQIVVSRTGNIDVRPLCEEFEARNPDVQVVYLDITGGNAAYKPPVDWITKGYAPDIMFCASSFLDDARTTKYFKNLSTDPVIQHYEASALKRTAVDNDVYWLPGPSNISAMIYNKTLFDRYGWEVPETFDAFVRLCDRIREDTGGAVEPWNPNAKYAPEFLTAIEAFTYEELFGGVENRAWYNDFVAGNASFSGHMEPFMQVLSTLIEHGILREEHFSYSATARGKEFAAGKIAMLNMNLSDADSDLFDFGYMPYPTTKGTLGYLCDSYSCYTGLPIKKHTDKQEDAINRFLAFLSSPEGQATYIGKSVKVSNVKGAPLGERSDLAALQPAIDSGHMFAMLDFSAPSGQICNIDLRQNALDMASGKTTAAQAIAAIDANPYSPAGEEPGERADVLATAATDLTILETSFYIADAYRAAAGADIGLITHNEPYRGNMMKIFSGDLTEGIVSVMKPRSFANGSKLVKLEMSGRQILDALGNPVGYEETADCVYAYSGLQCEIAPWNPLGEKVLSVKMADGSPLEADKLYTVAAWEGTVAEQYITRTLNSFEGAWEALMTAKLRADKTVSPCDDERVTLVWKAA